MKLQALRFNADPKAKGPVRAELLCDRQQDLEQARSGLLPAVFLVSADDLPGLRKFTDLILDRGIKHERTGLSARLLGQRQDKIAMIEGIYCTPGRVLQSIARLLNNACKRKESSVYIVGVQAAFFQELWQQAHGAAGVTSAAGAPVRSKRSRSVPRAQAGDPPSFADLLGHVKEPEGLADAFIGASDDARLVRQLIIRAAAVDTPVLILGDTGTGKEVVARQIHRLSPRRNAKFVTVNCGAIPADLFESELFGHEWGAFTNAVRQKTGLWAVAGEGTLFLDEIGDLALNHQVKILHALEQGKVRPVGATESVSVRARVIAATNRDLFAMTQAGTFREDLFYRILGILIRTPALRDHPDDIPLLVRSFWKEITGNQRACLPRDTLEELKAYGWPGNARELRMMLTRVFSSFQTQKPRPAQLRQIFYYDGRRPGIHDGPVSKEEMHLHRAECLRHLKRVDEVIQTAAMSIRSFAKGGEDSGPKAAASLRVSLCDRIEELDLLCRRPLLLRSDHTLDAIRRLRGHLDFFQAALESDPAQALAYRQSILKKELKLATTTVMREVKSLLQ